MVSQASAVPSTAVDAAVAPASTSVLRSGVSVADDVYSVVQVLVARGPCRHTR